MKSRTWIAAGVATLLLGLAVSQPAYATDESQLAANQIKTILTISPEVFRDKVTQPATSGSDTALYAKSNNASVEVMTDPQNPVSLVSPRNGTVKIGLPFASQASDAVSTDSGTVSFDNKNNFFTVPVVKSDASVQIMTVLKNSSAPSGYDYALAVPEGGSVQLTHGVVVIKNAAGKFSAVVAPAWAKDALGNSVSTHYEINKTTLTQVVEHSGKQPSSYPIVADPWVGSYFFDSIYQDKYQGQPAVHIVPSGISRTLEATGNNWLVRDSGWGELKMIWPEVRTKATYEQQYKCHAQFATVPWLGGNTWDLEKVRSNLDNWFIGAVFHHCNW